MADILLSETNYVKERTVMVESNCNYQEYFHINQRAQIGLPLGNSRFFREWAIIGSIDNDLMNLQLSRDMLPEDVVLAKGEPLTVRAGSAGQGYRCHAVIEQLDRENLTAKLTGSIIPDELRSYFRLDTELEFRYSSADSEEAWNLPGNRCIVGAGKTGSIASQGLPNVGLLDPTFSGSNGVIARDPVIINISGGGLRAQTLEEIQVGSLLKVAFHLPHTQPQQVQTTAEVIYCQPMPSLWRTGTQFLTGMRYMKIHERHRDSIIKYVCSEEIKKIRSCNKQFHSLSS